MSIAPAETEPSIDIAVESDLWHSIANAESLIARAVTAGIAEAGIRTMPGAELSVLLCDDAQIAKINLEWRGKDKPTNVLSFPAVTPAKLKTSPLLGDIAIAFETVQREAFAEDKHMADHLSHLTIHGLLHLLGFDHETPQEAQIMEACEIRALARLGIADPYADSDVVES
jgi:probable rRNA maturation factor